MRVMGVVNVSPESFYTGSIAADSVALRDAVQQLEAEGADFLDVGAMSTAPYLKTAVPVEEELRRMTAAVEVIAAAVRVPISVDSPRAVVVRAALAAGARVVNDIGGLRGDPQMAEVVRSAEGCVLMACEPAELREGEAPIALVGRLLGESLAIADRAGIDRQRIVLDPGIGFFTRQAVSSLDFNLALLRELPALETLGRPLLVGVSRKSFIGKITGNADPDNRLFGSLGATAWAAANGASLIRTHDVAATRDAVRVVEAIVGGKKTAVRPG